VLPSEPLTPSAPFTPAGPAGPVGPVGPVGPIDPFGLIARVDSNRLLQLPLFKYLKTPVFLFAHKTMSELPARIVDAKEVIDATVTKNMPSFDFPDNAMYASN
jgi:hypothetical protein